MRRIDTFLPPPVARSPPVIFMGSRLGHLTFIGDHEKNILTFTQFKEQYIKVISF